MTGGVHSVHRNHFHYIGDAVSALELADDGAPQDAPSTDRDSTWPPNVILWIGGLGDTLGSVSYPFQLARRLPPGWSLAVVSLSSAGTSWGTTTLDKDVSELASLVAYFRAQRHGKLVLMGHSTGCQDTIHYLSSPSPSGTRPSVDGAILQAPMSDREALGTIVEKSVVDAANEVAKDLMAQGKADDCLPSSVSGPIFPGIAITARRWLSLASPDGKGQDDYFSSDLPDDRLESSFGKVPRGTAMLFLFGGEEEFKAKHVDGVALLKRWKTIAERVGVFVHPDSTDLVPGATHNLNTSSPDAVQGLCDRVLKFIDDSLTS